MSIAELYVAAQQSFCDYFASIPEADHARPVPCTPAWTVRDVLSHTAGVADDITAGRTDGAATDPWTASQVERYRDVPWQQLLTTWAEQAPSVGAAVEFIGEHRPPIDCHSHEHDIRHALSSPANQTHPVIGFACGRAIEVGVDRPLQIDFADGTTAMMGEGDPVVTLRGISRFELVRSRLGRRSRDQVLGFDWSVTPDDALLDAWFMFGPSPHDIEEADVES